MLMLLLASCDRSTTYSQYAHIPDTGWERNDSLFFDIPAITSDGRYASDLQLRLDRNFPYLAVSATVEVNVWPSGRRQRYTIDCQRIDDNGQPIGKGLGYYNCHFLIDTLSLLTGDSLHICVTHHMQQEVVKGVKDLGIRLSKH